MAEKRKSRTAVVSEGAAQSVLRRAVAPELSSEEEKVMRMRLGATPPRTARLERAALDAAKSNAVLFPTWFTGTTWGTPFTTTATRATGRRAFRRTGQRTRTRARPRSPSTSAAHPETGNDPLTS